MKKFLAILSILLFSVTTAQAESQEYKIKIKNHKFEPSTLTIPADTKIKLIVENQDSTIEEFESHELNREKLIGAGKSITLFIGPLDTGKYGFYGEFHPKTAQGTLIVK